MDWTDTNTIENADALIEARNLLDPFPDEPDPAGATAWALIAIAEQLYALRDTIDGHAMMTQP
tara:strand:+ start:166 stop:354 length:189 start_codon:yes stop_codon:yes gene_type:complete